MTGEFRKWPEFSWLSDTDTWKSAEKITAGIDIGTTSSQAAVFADDELFGYASIHTGADFTLAANTVIAKALASSALSVGDIGTIAATGFGRRNVLYATKTQDEISCIAKGARFIYGPAVTTVLDMGGQTTKAILLHEWDRVREFEVSDKCATGMGRHIETAAEILRVPLTEMGDRSLETENDPEPVSTTCFNFAYSEMMSLFREGYKEDMYKENEVIASYLFAVAWRILGTVGKLAPLDIGDIKIKEVLGFTGGLAKNKGITKRIERELNITAIEGKHDPQLAAAIGAALLA
ncbi:MAG: acyl-CoA dehydratase activase [Clostridiales Family XIII bacterium]|jgi:benzoyl-CoA reductase subunit A|nr:acyl-CoA dehydratase activase [Clostridiales Family XIII bacterium]